MKVPCIPEVEVWIFLYPDLLPQAQVTPSQFLHQVLCQTRLYLSLYAPLSRFLLPKEAEPVTPLILFYFSRRAYRLFIYGFLYKCIPFLTGRALSHPFCRFITTFLAEKYRGLSFCHIVLLYKIQKARLSPGLKICSIFLIL